MGRGRLCAALLAGFAACLAGAGAVRAGSPEAVALAGAGRCEEALPFLETLPQAPQDTLLRSRCLVRLRRYAEAAPLLEALVEQDPDLAEAWLHLGMARFHLGDPAGAEVALLRAEPALAARPELRLYRGLAQLARGDAAGAAARLDGVSEGSAGPIAGYWAGIAWIRAGEAARGRDALRRVLALAPESPWAAQAAQALRGSAEPGRRWWIRATAGYEYDDNVVLRAGDVPLAREISSQRDTRAMWRLEAGSEWWRREAWSSGVWLNYSGTDHDDLSALDVHLPGIGLWLDRRLGPGTTARLVYDFSWAFVDEESFLQSHGLTASAFHSLGSAGTTQLFGRVYGYDYRVEDVDVPDGRGVAFSPCPSPTAFVCGAAGVEEDHSRDRDGYGTASGFLHAVRVDGLRTELWAGYTYFRYWAEGKEQSYAAHEARLGAQTQLPLGFEVRVDAAYAYRPYRHASSVPQPFQLFLNREYPTRELRRRDDVLRVEVGLERRIADRVRIGVLYSYIDNDSNLELFDYDRQIVGSYLTIGLGPGRWTR